MSSNGHGNGHDASLDLIEDQDRMLRFTLPERNARGRVVRLVPTLNAILANHDYPPLLARLLGEALVLTALLGSTLKDSEGQMTIQAQAQNGIVDLLVADWRAGQLRGYLRHDPERLGELPDAPTLDDLFGDGYLGITFDLANSEERYQGIVPLTGASLAEAAESYFAQSEQIPSLVRLAVVDGGPAGWSAGGLLLQHLPEGELGRERLHTRMDHPDWEHVLTLAATVEVAELTDRSLALETLLWRLFNEDEVRLLGPAAISRGCRCTVTHFKDVLSRFPKEERADMRGEDGRVHVDCAFCARSFPIDV